MFLFRQQLHFAYHIIKIVVIINECTPVIILLQHQLFPLFFLNGVYNKLLMLEIQMLCYYLIQINIVHFVSSLFFFHNKL